jgi:uncharacterized protein (DUF433 family)
MLREREPLRASDAVTINPKVMLGKPTIRDTRVTAELILRKLGAGMTEQDILSHHPQLSVEDVRSAASYAADQLAGSPPGYQRRGITETGA